MSVDDELRSYLNGLKSLPAIQAPPGKASDPQLVAFDQYLQLRADWLTGRDLIDYGCGYGIVAERLSKTWKPAGTGAPRYVAVDFPAVLEKLAVPIDVELKRIPIENFFVDELKRVAGKTGAVVIRNVLHELDISATGRLFAALATHLPPDADVYIQDFQIVKPAERLNPGWNAGILNALLSKLGFTCLPPATHKSHSGTEWVVIIARSAGKPLDPETAAKAVADARQKQKEIYCNRLIELKGRIDEESVAEFLNLSVEVSAIESRIQEWQYEQPRLTRVLSAVSIPVLDVAGPTSYAEDLPSAVSSATGIAAVISSKNVIDFPRLLDGCARFAYFAGYSERALFARPQTEEALERLVAREPELRILLTHPESPAVAARVIAPVYKEKNRLEEDIHASIKAFDAMRARLVAKHGASIRDRCQLRLTQQLPACAYFMIDDACYTSLYTQSLSGGSGPAIVYRPGVERVSYYDILMKDFTAAWEAADGK